MASNKNDGAYAPSDDSDNSPPQTPNKITKKGKPTKKKASSPTTPSIPKTTRLSSRKASKNPDDDDQKSPKAENPEEDEEEEVEQQDEGQQDGEEEEEEEEQKKKKPTRRKNRPTTYIRSFPDIPPDDERMLCGRLDSHWENNKQLKKEELITRLDYYIRPRDKKHIPRKKQESKTKHDLAIGLKQIYFDRNEADRWSADELLHGTGLSGADYENTCRQDGRLPSQPSPDIPKKPRGKQGTTKTPKEK